MPPEWSRCQWLSCMASMSVMEAWRRVALRSQADSSGPVSKRMVRRELSLMPVIIRDSP